jgi:preprotein translocase subunit SecA
MPHFDVQLLAGIALASGAITEMQTGEGKTLASTLPAALHALSGHGVHVATVNAYLASRDFNQLRPLYELLGLTVGLAVDGDNASNKRSAYECDITYATGYELGFDYLRDQLQLRESRREEIGSRVRQGLQGRTSLPARVVQRSRVFAIIDEVDSVLIDEATTPLVLSTGAGQLDDAATQALKLARDVARDLTESMDFVVEKQRGRITLTECGMRKAHARFSASNGGLMRPWADYIENALHADLLFTRDANYIVQDDKVRIVDENTGRIFSDRTWQRGLHQALEVKESVPVTEEARPVASISRQRFFQLYDQLCGMTGTAAGHEAELFSFYGLPVVQIPLRRPCLRVQQSTAYFGNADAKYLAICHQTAKRYRQGQPVLIGARTIADSHHIASKLGHHGVPFRLLNGVQDEDEAALIATAGEAGTVTIATNMAGRGTDITPSTEAVRAGGLHVIASQRHNSRRIDRQLIGRAARQGDPGSSQFFVSSEDWLVQGHSSALDKFIRGAGDEGTSSARADHLITRIQKEAEHQCHEQRQRLMQHELWLDDLRSSVA